MCQLYIKCATTLFNYYIDDEETQEFLVFVGCQNLIPAMKLRPKE